MLLLLVSIGLFAQGQSNQKVTIFWDVSYSMQDRDLNKEFYFLDAYFKTTENVEVTLLTFSNDVNSKDNFSINAGNWSALKEKLKSFNYDGATSFETLDDYAEKGDVLVFTDGNQNMGSSAPNFDGEVYIVNSKKDFDRASINLLAIVNNGNLVNLTEKRDSESLGRETQEYSGTIFSGTMGLELVDVFIKENPTNKVKTNELGIYKINAVPGETLVISYGNRIKEQTLGTVQQLDFNYDTSRIDLQEVVVTDDKLEVEDEITTGFGKENKDKVGYAVQSISEEVIPDAATTGNKAIQGKFSGVRLGQNDDLSQVVMRPSNSILGNNYGLIVIDGVPTRRSNSGFTGLADVAPERGNDSSMPGGITGAGFIDPRNIAEITVLKGLAATNRFGSMGANGVLLITTKTALVDGPKGQKKDLARLTDNVYDGKLKVNKKALVTDYLKELKNGKNIQEAYDIYLKQRKKYWDLPEYLVDISAFFFSSNKNLGYRILSNILEKPAPTHEELRGLYLKSIEGKNYYMALLAANRLLEDFPNKTQSYLDVAMANKGGGNYQEALNALVGMASGESNLKLNFNGLEKIVGTEIRNLVNQKRKDLDVTKVSPSYLNNLTYNARLVLEWNNPDAEFTVQFVNPQNRFFNWEHTDVSERKRILDGLQHGYASEQFEIVGAETVGDWILNVTYFGNRTLGNKMPTFLKCRVQYNFGKPNQRSEEFLVRLQLEGEEQQLAKFSVE